MSSSRSSSIALASLGLFIGLVAPAASAQDGQAGVVTAPESSQAAKGRTPPKPIHRVEPEYTREAIEAGLQGTVLFGFAVSETGMPVDIQLLKPLGFGLDEMALRALQQWRFEPARKDGQAVRFAATVQINFRLIGKKLDKRVEEQRAEFAQAFRGLAGDPGPPREQSIKSLRNLAQAKYPPAMYVLGVLLQKGDGMDRDVPRGEALIQQSANRKYGPALFATGLSRLKSATQPAETAEALRLITEASVRGNYNAQFYIGDASEKGTHGPPDLERAIGAFRFCAASGHADCQLRLAKLLLGQSPQSDHALGVAWLQVAADQGQPDAIALLRQESPRLTADEFARVRRLKPQLQQKP